MVKNKGKLLAMFGMCSFLPSFIVRSIDLSLPAIGKEFDMTIIALSWVVTAYLLTTAALVIPFGRLADIVGRKKIFLGGVLLFAITTLLCGVAFSGNFLIAARALQGIAVAMIFGTATALLVSIFPPHERGRALGMTVSCVFLGSSSGPALGGIITQYWGWRSLFFLTAIPSIIVVIMGRLYLNDEKTESHGESFDSIGSVLYAIAIVTLLFGTTQLPTRTGIIAQALGLLFFIMFCVAQRYITHPIIDLDLLLKNKAFAMANVSALLSFCALFSVPFLMSLFLQYIRGMNPQNSGLIILALPIAMVIGSPIAGKLSDQIDPKIIASLGLAISSLTLFIIGMVIQPDTPLPLLAGLLLLLGTGISLFASPNTNAAMSSVSKRHLGIAASVVNTMRMFGQAISMSIATVILRLTVGKVEVSAAVLPQLMSSIQYTFLIFGLLSFLGIVASLARGQQQRE